MKIGKQKEEDILETQGLWEASSYIRKQGEKSRRKRQPIRIGLIRHAHKLIFQETKLNSIGGRYRREGEQNHLKRIDGSTLQFPSWDKIPERMAVLDNNLVFLTHNIKIPVNERELEQLIEHSARIVHQFVCIHPFVNGNGRASRLLLDTIFIRTGLRRIITTANKKKYYTAMLQADKGDYSMLEEIAERGILKGEEMIFKQKLLAQDKNVKEKRNKLHKRKRRKNV